VPDLDFKIDGGCGGGASSSARVAILLPLSGPRADIG
jgi:hypothetical protein